MKSRKGGRQHISEEQPAHVQSELTRNLLGHLRRSWMIADQHRALYEGIKDRDDLTMPRRSTDPFDPSNQERMLRGVPVTGYGGAINGTRPGRGKRLDDWSGRPLDEEES